MDKTTMNNLIKEIEKVEKQCSKECIQWTKCIVNISNSLTKINQCNDLLNNYIDCIDKNGKK